MIRAFLWLFGLLLVGVVSCSEQEGDHSSANAASNDAPGQATSRNVVLFLGDSLTAGYGLSSEQAYPALVAALWRRKGLRWRVRNAGVSGYTSADLRANLAWSLTPDVHTVFLAIGANDGLRGQDLKSTEENIGAIVAACRQRGIQVVLAGMKMPPNYGSAYAGAFEALYPRVARRLSLPCMPFLLQDVAGKPDYNLADGIHPNALGHRIIARNVISFFEQEKILP